MGQEVGERSGEVGQGIRDAKERVGGKMAREDIKPTVQDKNRDLGSDLTVCDAATDGPWVYMGDDKIFDGEVRTCDKFILIADKSDRPDDMFFIAEAREGWPAAIRRAMEAEAEVKRLKLIVSELDPYGYTDEPI